MNRVPTALVCAAVAALVAGCSSTAPRPRPTTPTPASAATAAVGTPTPTTASSSSTTPTTAPTVAPSSTWTDTPTAANTQTWTTTSTPTSSRTSTPSPTNSGTSTQTPIPTATPTCYAAGGWVTASVVPRRYCFVTTGGTDVLAVCATGANLDLNFSSGCGGNPSSVSSTRPVGKVDYLLFRGANIGAGVCEEGRVVSASGASSYVVGLAPVVGSIVFTGTVGPIALDAGKAAVLVMVSLDAWNSHTFTLSGTSGVMMYLHDPSPLVVSNLQTVNDSVMVVGGVYGQIAGYPAQNASTGAYTAVVVNDGLQTGSFTLSVSIP